MRRSSFPWLIAVSTGLLAGAIVFSLSLRPDGPGHAAVEVVSECHLQAGLMNQPRNEDLDEVHLESINATSLGSVAVILEDSRGSRHEFSSPQVEVCPVDGDVPTHATSDAMGYQKVAPGVFGVVASTARVSVVVSLAGAPAPRSGEFSSVALAAQLQRVETIGQRVLSSVPSGEFELSRRYGAVPAFVGNATAAGVAALAAHPDVAHVALNHKIYADLAEAVPLIRADDVHSLLSVTGAGVVVAVLDTGIDTDHPMLVDHINHQKCFLDAGTCPGGGTTGPSAEDGDSHGSHVSGIITSTGPPVGIAPDALIDAFKVLDDSGAGTVANILAAYDEIINFHPEVDVINMSLDDNVSHAPGTCDGIVPALTNAIATTRAMGMITFAASGNNGSKVGTGHPACINDVVSVGAVYDANVGLQSWGLCGDATTAPDQVVCFSQSDLSLDLLAPGSRINSTVPGGGLSNFSGTSMASPAAAAVAALLLESEPLLSPADVETRLKETGVPVTDAGNGGTTCRVDAYEAAVNDGGPICASAAPPTCPPEGCPAVEFISTGVVPEGDTPTEVLFTPDGSKIVVAHRDSQNIVIFDANTRVVAQTIPVTGSPNAMAISSDGIHAVTANIYEDTASIVDLVTGAEVAVVPVGARPSVVRITPDGTTAVVGNTLDSTLSIIDIATATELRRIADAPFAIVTSISYYAGIVTSTFTQFELPDNNTAILPDLYGSRIQFFDIAAGTASSLASSGSPAAVAITSDGTKAVVAHEGNVQRVSVIDVASQSIDKTISTGADLRGRTIAINPSGTKAVVSLLNNARVVDLVTDAVSGNLATACCLRLRVTADGQYVFAGGFRGSLISFDTQTIVADLNSVLLTNVVATSPTGPRAAAVAHHFGEEMLVFNTTGAAGFLEGIVPSGPPPEGDKAGNAAISPDGSTAVVANILSDNATIINLPNGLVKGVVALGDRPDEVEITPDGAKAVVVNLDSPFVSVIDLQTLAVTNVDISRRGSEVEIAPDGSFAYVAVVADGDGVWRIDLSSLTVAGPKIPIGNMGGIGGLFSRSSGMALSHDGATLVTANSYDNNISIIDTASWSEVARVPVGGFPVRAAFSPSDAEIYVSNSDSATVSIVSNAGASSTVTGTISVGTAPFELVVAPDGSRLYVADSIFGGARIAVVNLPGTAVTNSIWLADVLQGLHLDSTENRLYASVGRWSIPLHGAPSILAGSLIVIDTQTESVLARINTGLPPYMLAFDDGNSLAVIPSPFGDGVTLVDLSSQAGPVGGIAEVPDVARWPIEKPGSSGGGLGFPAGMIAAAVAGSIALCSVAWYTRRRWLR